jgi:hypothetical protein
VIAATPQWQRLLILIPAFLIGGGIVLGTLILLARAFMQYVQESEHKRWIYASLVALVAVVVLATYLGIKIPNEE